MKRLRWLVLPIVVVVMIAGGVPRAATVHASVQDFDITDFSADYYLSRNQAKTSQLKVVEHITAVFPDYDQNHGILRSLPETYQNHTVSLHIDSVTNDTGRPWKYTTSHQNDNLVLKIGNANSYVQGQQSYVITYHMSNVALLLPDHDEFYWDINGDQWPQAMKQVTARIHLTPDLANNVQERQVCYAGSYGSQAQNCQMTRQTTPAETVVTASAADMQPYQTLTTVLGFNQNTFVLGPEIAAAKRHKQLIAAAFIGSAVLPPLITTAIMYNRWRKFGRDPKGRGVIVAQYEPPKGLNALSSGYLLNERLPQTAVTAAIIELAIQRYLDISEVKTKKLVRTTTDYQLTLLKDYSGLSPEQQRVITAFFSGGAVGDTVLISSLKNKLHSDVSAIDTMLGKSMTAQEYFQVEPSKARGKYGGRGALLLIIGFLICFTGILAPLGIGLIISAIIIFIASSRMPARSLKGVETQDYLMGVKEFIKVVEEKRLEYLQSPEGAEKTGITVQAKTTTQKVTLFESLLPYAMLFGLEKGWAKQFEDIYPEAPDWYHGDYNTFRTAYLASAISNLSSANSQAFSSPSSSSSSGFSGGGFSGGGGGGGGGGGW